LRPWPKGPEAKAEVMRPRPRPRPKLCPRVQFDLEALTSLYIPPPEKNPPEVTPAECSSILKAKT